MIPAFRLGPDWCEARPLPQSRGEAGSRACGVFSDAHCRGARERVRGLFRSSPEDHPMRSSCAIFSIPLLSNPSKDAYSIRMNLSEFEPSAKRIADSISPTSASENAVKFSLATVTPMPTATQTIVDRVMEEQRHHATWLALSESPLIRAARELTGHMDNATAPSLSGRLEALVGIGDTMHQLMTRIRPWGCHIADPMDAMTAQTFAFQRTLDSLRLPKFDLDFQMTGVLAADTALAQLIKEVRLPEIARDFSRLSAGFYQIRHEDLGVNEPITASLLAIPSRELFLSGDACLAFKPSERRDPEWEAERESLREEIDLYSRPTLEMILADLDERLVELWRGAHDAAQAGGSDSVRHVLTSLRELYSHLLRLLAPDAAVRDWSTQDSDFSKGRPTRPARLRFALRYVRSPSLMKFLELDMKGVAELVDLFNRGAHGIDPPLSPQELPFVVRRVEGFLCALVEARRIVASGLR